MKELSCPRSQGWWVEDRRLHPRFIGHHGAQTLPRPAEGAVRLMEASEKRLPTKMAQGGTGTTHAQYVFGLHN